MAEHFLTTYIGHLNMQEYPVVSFNMVVRDFESQESVCRDDSNCFRIIFKENGKKFEPQYTSVTAIPDKNTNVLFVEYKSKVPENEKRDLIVRIDINGVHNLDGEEFTFKDHFGSIMYLDDYTASGPDLGPQLQAVADSALTTLNAKCNASNVNVREERGLDNPVIYKLQKGEGVTVLSMDKSENSDYGILKKKIAVKSGNKKTMLHKGKWVKKQEYNKEHYKASTVIDGKEIAFIIKKNLVDNLGSFARIKTASGVTGWAVKKYLDPAAFTTLQYWDKRTALPVENESPQYWERKTVFTGNDPEEDLAHVRVYNEDNFIFMGVVWPAEKNGTFYTNIYEYNSGSKQLYRIDTFPANVHKKPQGIISDIYFNPYIKRQSDNLVINNGELNYYEESADSGILINKKYKLGSRKTPVVISKKQVESGYYADRSYGEASDSPDGKLKAYNSTYDISIKTNTQQPETIIQSIEEPLKAVATDPVKGGYLPIGNVFVKHELRDLLIGTICWSNDSAYLYFDNSGIDYRCIWEINLKTKEITKIIPEHNALHPFCFIKNGKPHIAYTEYNKIKIAYKK